VAKLPRVVPPVPESVRADPVAFAEWRRMTPILQRARLLHEASQTALAAYCLAVSRSLQAHARYARGGGVLPRGARPGPLPPGLGRTVRPDPATDDVSRRRFGLCRTA
jgi:phage terminase small subunit